MLEKFGDDIWTTDGSTVEVLGFRYPTRMVLIRLSDESLFVWSPIALSDELRAEVDALGVVAHIVAPNSLHHLSVLDWQRAYPAAKTYAPPKLRDKRPDIRFDEDLGDEANAAWAGDIDQVVVQGNAITSEVVFFHRRSETVLFTDLLQQFPDNWFSGWRKIVAKLDLMVSPEPAVPRKFRVAFKDRQAAREAMRRILAWPAQKLVMAHGSPVTRDAKGALARAFAWLKV
ncbi:DUF4336 domain-containing protein [Celeribacter arenosi]|uniref:DUF4336 domain-containing protein n=1 Tax=Celeribacter arenosi TaxID=792649 RepID=A0ABP7JTJ0_9RHOB